MKRKHWIGVAVTVVALGVALATACSSSRLRSVDEEPPPTATGTPTPGTTGATGATGTTSPSPAFGHPPVIHAGTPVRTERFQIRLAGEDVRGASAALLEVSSLKAWADGARLETRLESTRLDLSNEGNAYLIGSVDVPVGAAAVRFRLELDEGGGYAPAAPAKAGGVKASQVPIEWTSHVDWLKQRGHTVVHLDVARSFARAGDGWTLLPQLMVLH